MSNFARVIHHIDMKDVKRKRLEEIAAKKLKEEKDRKEKELIKEISRKYKSDWKTELSEKMTTGAVFTTTIAPAEDDGTVNAIDVIDASSYSGTVTGMLGADEKSGNTGSVIRDSGSGSGQDGGFNVGGKYLSFQGDGYNVSGHAIRWAALSPIDSSRINSLTITAIVGNDSNGGEDPDASAEDLRLMYKTPSMDTFRLILFNPTGGVEGAIDSDIIIPLGASGNSGLNNYSIEIPEWAREKNTQFALIQLVSSGTGFDNYGITNIKFQRTTPVNVVVPLDDPQAISFVRVGSDEGDPKKRKKKLNDQLAASDEYTQAQLGDDFPGGGARVGGDDPFASAKIGDDVEPSPIGKAEVKKSFSTFSTDTAVATATNDTTTDTGGEDPEVITTRQSTIATDPEGNEIDPESVAAGAVQGADATNLDQDEPTEPEPTEPEPIDPDQEEAEKEAETEPDVEDKSEEELNQQLDDKANALQKLLTMRVTRDLDGFKNLAKVAKFAVQGFVSMLTIIDRLNPFTKQNTEVNTLQGGLSVILNSLDIAVSVMDGKITKSNPTAAQIETYKNSILPDLFKSDSASYIPISDIRHEYADDNIYVERINGKAVVRDNTSGIKQNLTFKGVGVGGNYKGFDQVGGGYSQFIIPKDGGEPYIHYYDYNYENIYNPAYVAFGGGVLESGKFDAGALMKSL